MLILLPVIVLFFLLFLVDLMIGYLWCFVGLVVYLLRFGGCWYLARFSGFGLVCWFDCVLCCGLMVLCCLCLDCFAVGGFGC